MLQVNVLGPLDVHDDGTPVAPTAPKPRQMLGLLALRAGRPVGVDALAEELWEENPPPSATTTIQTYVRAIRRAMGADIACVESTERAKRMLQTRPGAYALDLGGGALDVSTFEDLTGRGRAAREVGDLPTASRLFRSALAVWRGPALTDLRVGPLLRAQVTRLEECRLAVLEQRIEVDLALGRERAMLSELAELNVEHPLHERFCAHLMLALYRAGRQAEALHAFVRLRAALVDELGVEPSPRLQRDLQAILRSEVEPDAASPRRAGGHVA